MFFIPTIDELSGDLTYTFDLFESIDNIETLIIVMPEEFSIALEDEEEEQVHPSIVVKLTFYDLIQSWSKLLLSDKIIIYHDIEIDRAGIELEGLRNKFWGSKNDPIIDFIHIARNYFRWLQDQISNEKTLNKEMYVFFSKFYQKEGLVDFDETDSLQKIIFDSLIKQMRTIFEKRKKYTRKLTKKMFEILDQHYKNQAIIEWDNLMKQGKLLYYAPKKKPIL
ncbi:MAG: hypothetical protein ACFFCM_13890 [Promethearchaeota archaeon]